MDRRSEAAAFLRVFADRTGLDSDRPERRYLWTDAFAVCTLLGLGDARLALRLVDRVHEVLGKHRPDAEKRGWLSGLPDVDARVHPTIGGLRIGKPLPERRAGERFDPELEWERDGQYFHYLTKWATALDCVARRTSHADAARWARELMISAHEAFTYGPVWNRRMYWKMSADLTRPLVPSMGQHDPLDGYVTCLVLERTEPDPKLASAAEDFAGMISAGSLVTADPLGIGGLLVDAARLRQLEVEPELASSLESAAAVGIDAWLDMDDIRAPAERRLAFRELGLAIGLAAASSYCETPWDAEIDQLREEIERFWTEPSHRATPSWRAHEDINEVMLATSLAPEGFLSLDRARASRRPRAAARRIS